MLPIFTDTYNTRGSVSNHPGLARFKELSKITVRDLINYYASNVRAVYGDHPLSQVITHMPTWMTDPVELSDISTSRYPYLSRNLGFTTDFNRGSLKGHKVYPYSDNLIFATHSYISPFKAVSNWTSLSPVKCFWMDTEQLELSVPDSKKTVTHGLYAMSVDIPKLTLMYKGYKETESQRRSGELILGPQHFVATHVLPSIVPSQLDMSCISSTIAIYNGTYTNNHRVDEVIYLPTRSTDFENIARKALERLDGSRMQYVHMLQHIPTVFAKDGLEALRLPDFVPTTQVQWAMFITRLKIIDFLLEVGGKQGRDANRGFINQLKIFSRDIRMSQIPYTSMSDRLAGYIDNTLTKFINLK